MRLHSFNKASIGKSEDITVVKGSFRRLHPSEKNDFTCLSVTVFVLVSKHKLVYKLILERNKMYTEKLKESYKQYQFAIWSIFQEKRFLDFRKNKFAVLRACTYALMVFIVPMVNLVNFLLSNDYIQCKISIKLATSLDSFILVFPNFLGLS